MNNEIIKDGNDFIVEKRKKSREIIKELEQRIKEKKEDLTKEQKSIKKAYDDTFTFLKENTKNWSEDENCGSYVCYGMISAIFQCVFSFAPSKKDAMIMIRSALYNQKIAIMFEEIEEDKDKKKEDKDEK